MKEGCNKDKSENHTSQDNLSDPVYIYRHTNEKRDSDALPIRATPNKVKRTGHVEVFKALFLKALNNNQLLIMENIEGEDDSLNSFLRELSDRSDTPLSTLKLNARILKDLELIDYGTRKEPEPVILTEHGETILDILEVDQ